MAFPASGVFVPTMVGALNNTLALDLSLDTHKVALWTDTGTYDLHTNTAYGVAPWNANEVPNGSGYTTGGNALTGTTYAATGATGGTWWDATDTPWTSSTFSGVRGCLIYADVLAGNEGIMAVNFGAAYGVTSGTFTIQWNVSGILTIDWMP